MTVISKIKLIIKNPGLFWDQIQNENNSKGVLDYFFYFILPVEILIVLLTFIFSSNQTNASVALFAPNIGTFMAFSVLFSFVAILLLVLVSHLFIKSFGGKGGILKTFQGFIYGMTPGLIFGPILSVLTLLAPSSSFGIGILNLILSVWIIKLELSGLRKLHGLSVKKILAVFASATVIFLIVIGGIGIMFALPKIQSFIKDVAKVQFSTESTNDGLFTDGNINITIPKTWKKISMSSEASKSSMTIYAFENDVFSIITTPSSTTSASFISQSLDAIKNGIANEYNTPSSEVAKITFAGQETVYSKTKSESKNGEIFMQTYQFTKGGFDYMISEISPVSTSAQDQSIFDEINKSIKFK